VLYLAVNAAGLDPFPRPLRSIMIAATVTWKASRHFIFASTDVAVPGAPARKWLRYVSTTATGGAINNGFTSCGWELPTTAM